jgi:hypothetical protein
MKLTIVTSDGKVCKDNLCYSSLTWDGTPADVHALQWLDISGSIEFLNGVNPNEDIAVLPDWANNAMASWQVAYDNAHKPAPEPLPPTADKNKLTASNLLSATDWTTVADVSNPSVSNPYLSNVSEFLTYRNVVRQYAVYPVAGNIVWPTLPTENWVKV